jgi:hypothetical protein
MKAVNARKQLLHHVGLWSLGLSLFLLSLPSSVHAQQILLDKPVKAGELTLFPDLNDATTYYYISDKPKLATDANGRPQFSFLRYVENVRTGADQAEAREGDGGGIVHALVALAVTPEQIREAQRALQRVTPGAKIQGPVVYRSGKFGLVSSFKDPDGKLSSKVVGLGNAPILDGEKAAISMQVTKLGAKILWESFQTAAPDISFSFEMDLAGYRSPQRAVIEANFDQIYEHQAFGAGIASPYLAAEIKVAFDDLKRQGAIKLTQVGENEKLETLITTAYNKIADMMFSPLGGTGTPSLESLAGGAGGQSSLLDRATTLLNQSRQEARTENERIRAENRQAEQDQRAAEERRQAQAATATSSTPASPTAGAGTTAAAPTPAGSTGRDAVASGGSEGATGAEEGRPRRRAEAPPNLGGSDTARARPADAPSAGSTPPARRQEETVPSFAVVASFEMKRVRQQGIFKVDLNKYTADHLTLRFDENIGDLRQHLDKPDVFRQVNLDDPLFRQRELVVFLDGLNSTDFGKYINFVSVLMRKRHGEGAETTDEVRIDRNNFNKEGNAFKLLYGWKGDTDRRKWLDYEYHPVWSFFGGRTVEEPWRKASAGAINVAPPFTRRIVELQADPKTLTDAGVRSITVKVYYGLGGVEQVKQVTLNAAKGPLSEPVEFMSPQGKLDYDYEITWQLKGDRALTSGRKKSSTDLLFVDELPPS